MESLSVLSSQFPSLIQLRSSDFIDTAMTSSNNFPFHLAAGDQYNVNYLTRVRWHDPDSDSAVHIDMVPSPNGWNVCVHPDGWKYFYKDGTVTDNEEIANLTAPLQRSSSEEAPDDIEELISPGPDDAPRTTAYVNHTKWFASPSREIVVKSDAEHTPGQRETRRSIDLYSLCWILLSR
jgi:hypothetical protein